MSCNSSALIFEARLCVASYSRRDALNAIAALLSLLIGFAAPGTAGTMRRVCESERVSRARLRHSCANELICAFCWALLLRYVC